jgi:hypothetical protein
MTEWGGDEITDHARAIPLKKKIVNKTKKHLRGSAASIIHYRSQEPDMQAHPKELQGPEKHEDA